METTTTNHYEPLLSSPRTAPTMLDMAETGEIFFVATNASVIAYVGLVAWFYFITPTEELVYLSGLERQTAFVAMCCLTVALSLTLMPVALQGHKRKKAARISAVVYAAIVVQGIAIATNALLCFCPTVVTMNRETQFPVYMMRWAEWIPLSGLMTFLADGLQLRDKASIRGAILVSLAQCVSCATGGAIGGYANDPVVWWTSMTISILTFLTMFPRVHLKRQAFLKFLQGGVIIGQREKYDRLYLSYSIMAICTGVWTILVLFYGINWILYRALPRNHPIFAWSPAMTSDTMFDVIAKSMYMRWIMEVHFALFDAEGKAMRQLSQLRNLMSVLWNQSSDVIVVSVRHDDKIVAILSPSFLDLIHTNRLDCSDRALLIVLEENSTTTSSGGGAGNSQDNPQRGNESVRITKAMFVDSSEIHYEQWSSQDQQQQVSSGVDASEFAAKHASRLITTAWHGAMSTAGEDGRLVTYPFKTETGEERRTEIKISQHGVDAIVCVIRDVTERYRCFEAERQAHAEVLRRQKDAQSQTRFVRHEVKNGLLAGIELCDNLKNNIDSSLEHLLPKKRHSIGDLDSLIHGEMLDTESISISAISTSSQKARKSVESLDMLLHEVLETVLAEAMARDVINEMYKPRSETFDVVAVLTSSVSTKSGKTERFPIEVEGGDLPFLQFDPQLLRYIHRNAVSNAAKYGKVGGQVNTVLSYEANSKMLTMNVVNEPGASQGAFIKMGHKKANEIVFSQGGSLHNNGNVISSGDGAWIVSKCAKAMGGQCSITFQKHKTVFSFKAAVEPIIASEVVCAKDFLVPPNTVGIAVDDSKIQRKLMRRMLANVGVQEEMMEVLGETPGEVIGLRELLLKKLKDYPESRILILVDEHLDYGGTSTEQAATSMISGSLTIQRVLTELDQESERRILSLVRSANDSAEDVAMYTKRTHGFIPKAPMHRERVREILAPQWTQRFMQKS